MIFIFGEKLKELRKINKLTQTDVAKIFNVTDATVSTWEVGKAQPSLDKLKELAKYFKVSTDFLLGITDDDITKIEKLNHVAREAGLIKDEDMTLDEFKKAIDIVNMLRGEKNEKTN